MSKIIIIDGGPREAGKRMAEKIINARRNNVDLILALGGGSVCDYSKGSSGFGTRFVAHIDKHV